MNGRSDLSFPAQTSSQFLIDGGSVLPALEESAQKQCTGVDEGRMSGEVGDGVVEGQCPPLGHLGTWTQLRQRVDAADVTHVEPTIYPAVRVVTQHRRAGSCTQIKRFVFSSDR